MSEEEFELAAGLLTLVSLCALSSFLSSCPFPSSLPLLLSFFDCCALFSFPLIPFPLSSLAFLFLSFQSHSFSSSFAVLSFLLFIFVCRHDGKGFYGLLHGTGSHTPHAHAAHIYLYLHIYGYLYVYAFNVYSMYLHIYAHVCVFKFT